MSQVREFAEPQVRVAGQAVQDLHHALSAPVSSESLAAAQRLSARLAELAAALSVAFSDAEVGR
jgi:hypothetical protein